MGKNEEKGKKLSGDQSFGSTVKDAFVKGATLQANNQTMLADSMGAFAQNTVRNYGNANAAYGNAYTQQADLVGNAAQETVNHWGNANAANSAAQLQQGLNIAAKANDTTQKNGTVWGMTTGVTGSDQTGASIWGYRNAGNHVVNQTDSQQAEEKIRAQIADGGKITAASFRPKPNSLANLR